MRSKRLSRTSDPAALSPSTASIRPGQWSGSRSDLLLEAWAAATAFGERDREAAERFAARAAVSLAKASPAPEPPPVLRGVRFHGEEAAAAALLVHAAELPSTEPVEDDRDIGVTGDVLVIEEGEVDTLLPNLGTAWKRVRGCLQIEGEPRFHIASAGRTESDIDPDNPGISARPLPGGRVRFELQADISSLPETCLAFFLGTALARMYFDHEWYRALGPSPGSHSDRGTLEPAGESARLRWLRLADFSTDRVGWLACGDLTLAVRTMWWAETGLHREEEDDDSGAAFVFAVERLRSFDHDITPGGERPHALATRVTALRRFAESSSPGYALGSMKPHECARFDQEILEFVESRKRHPESGRRAALMKALAAAGMWMLAADGHLHASEGRLLVRLLHRHFTDDPDIVLAEVAEDPKPSLADAIEVLTRDGTEADGVWLLEQTLRIATVDRALDGWEMPFLKWIVDRLGLSAGDVAGVFRRVVPSTKWP